MCKADQKHVSHIHLDWSYEPGTFVWVVWCPHKSVRPMRLPLDNTYSYFNESPQNMQICSGSGGGDTEAWGVHWR